MHHSESYNSEKRHFAATDLAALIIAVAGIFARPSSAGDPGVGWHLKTGEWILSNHAVPRVDPFLFGSIAKPWIATQWLADLFLYCLYQLGGFSLLHLCTVVLFVASHCVFPGQILRDKKLHAVPVVVALLLGSLVGSVQWILRPVLFGFLCFAIAFAHAYRLTESSANSGYRSISWRDYLGASLLFVLWANLHSSFALGWLVYGLALFMPTFRRWTVPVSEVGKRIGFVLLIILATLANPYGVALHRNMFGLVQSEYFMQLNKEWVSPDFHLSEFLRIAILWALVFFFALIGIIKRIRPFEAALCVILVFLSLKSRRYLPFCAIPFAVIIGCQLEELFSNFGSRLQRHAPSLVQLITAWRDSSRAIPTATSLLLAGTMLFVVMTDHLPLRRAADFTLDKHYPARILDSLELVRDTGRTIFHSPDFGGYITWRFYPRIRASIDDRNELNGEQAYKDYFTIVRMESGWQQLLDSKNFEWLLLDKKTTLAQYLAASTAPRWKLVAEDKEVVLYELVTTPTELNDLVVE